LFNRQRNYVGVGDYKMTVQDYLTMAVAICTIIGAFATATRWMVKHYLSELKPNSGSSLKDSVTRLERQVEEIYKILITGAMNEPKKPNRRNSNG
jgi:hypothetical protein